MDRVLAIIPARGGSKGLPRKNILPLDNKPMIAYTIEAVKKSKYVDRIIVSTEDPEIAQIAKSFGAKIPFMRPVKLAQDDTPGLVPILYTIEKLANEESYYPQYVLLLQPTSPLRNEKHIDEAFEMLIEHKESFDSMVSVTAIEHPVEWNRLIEKEGRLKDFISYSKETISRRQNTSKVYRLNGAIYISKTDTLLAEKSFETKNTMAYIMDSHSSIDIDTKLDFEWAEFLMKNKI